MTPELVALGAILRYAMANAPEKAAAFPLRNLIKRAKKGRAPHKVNGSDIAERVAGEVRIALPNEAIHDLKQDEGDAWFIVRVRKSVVDRMRSPIIRPGEERPS